MVDVPLSVAGECCKLATDPVSVVLGWIGFDPLFAPEFGPVRCFRPLLDTGPLVGPAVENSFDNFVAVGAAFAVGAVVVLVVVNKFDNFVAAGAALAAGAFAVVAVAAANNFDNFALDAMYVAVGTSYCR